MPVRSQFDKTMKSHTQEAFMDRLTNERFYASTDIDKLLERVARLTSKCVSLVVLVVRCP